MDNPHLFIAVHQNPDFHYQMEKYCSIATISLSARRTGTPVIQITSTHPLNPGMPTCVHFNGKRVPVAFHHPETPYRQ